MRRHTTWAYPTAVVQAALVVAVMCVVAGSLAMPARADDEDPLQAMLDQTDLKYRVLDENSYIVPFEIEGADEDETLDVFLTYNNDEKKFALMFCTILDYEDGHDFRPETMLRALRINNDFPAIKLCIDADNGDLDCQAEVYMRTLDAESLDMYINFVASMATKFAEELHALEEGEAVG